MTSFFQNSDSKPQTIRHSWSSLFGAIAAGLAFFLFFGIGAGLFFYGLVGNTSTPFDPNFILNYWIPASTFGFLGCLFLPSLLFRLAGWFGWSFPTLQQIRLPAPFFLLLLFVVAVLIGNQISRMSSGVALSLPIFHILAISLPVAFFLSLALRKTSQPFPQQRWMSFNLGMGLAPLLILIFESLAMIVFIIVFAFWIGNQPDLLKELEYLISQFRQTPPSSEAILKFLQPSLSQPGMITGIIVFTSIVIPMIEEAIKPLGVYFLHRKIQNELDGFILGALSGGGYALLESFLISSTNVDWTLTILSRSATAVIHIFTSALLGSAIARALLDKKRIQLFLTYLSCIFFHGVWNGLAIFYSLYSITDHISGIWQNSFLRNLANSAPLSIFFLFLYLTVALLFFRNSIRKHSGIMSL